MQTDQYLQENLGTFTSKHKHISHQTKHLLKLKTDYFVNVKKSACAYIDYKDKYNSKLYALKSNKTKLQDFFRPYYNRSDKEKRKHTYQNSRLKRFHLDVYTFLIKIYAEKIQKMVTQYDNMSFNPRQLMSMEITRSRIANYFEVSNETARNALFRLEEANVLRVVFHSHKHPLEVFFRPALMILEQNFVKASIPIVTGENVEKHHHKNDTGSLLQLNNNEYGVEFQPEQPISSKSDSKNNHNANSSGDDLDFQAEIKRISNLVPDLGENVETENQNQKEIEKSFHANPPGTKEKEKSSAKKEKEKNAPDFTDVYDFDQIQRVAKEIVESSNEQISMNQAINYVVQTMKKRQSYPTGQPKQRFGDSGDNNSNSGYRLHSFLEHQAKPLEQRQAEYNMMYAREMWSYMHEKLFAEKSLSAAYEKEVVNYLARNYFDQCKSQNEFIARMLQHRYRIDVASRWIESFRKPDGSPFDRSRFYPLPYLNIENIGQNKLSYANTKKFLKQGKEWAKLNGYRAMPKELREKVNRIVRAVYNRKLDFETGLKRVRALSESDEPVRQFTAQLHGSNFYQLTN